MVPVKGQLPHFDQEESEATTNGSAALLEIFYWHYLHAEAVALHARWRVAIRSAGIGGRVHIRRPAKTAAVSCH